ncbi:MAG: hypothetical protein K9N35_06490 [Candidatus Marinimicrobia bacterium]|nr:hypothetical protein [Candidatus Neomarinimicrobiota bacterium]
MDNIEKYLKKNLSEIHAAAPIDIEAVLAGTHRKIRKRAVRRKVAYLAPVLGLLLMLTYVMIPGNGEDLTLPGGELMIAGWESSWTNTNSSEAEDVIEQELFNQGIEYLIDEQFTSYSADMDDLMDEEDMEALVSFLREA